MKSMIRSMLVVFVVGGIWLVASVAAHAAAVDYFLKIDGIPGESTDDKHREEIDILSFSWGVSQTGRATASGGGGAGAGKVDMRDLLLSKWVDKATPLLIRASVLGQHIPRAILTCRKAGEEQQEFLVIELRNVFVTSVSTTGDTSDMPSEQMSLNFEEIKVTYIPRDINGLPLEPIVFDSAENRRGGPSRIPLGFEALPSEN